MRVEFELLRMGPFCAAVGLSPRQVRRLERLGLIRPQRSPGGQRVFCETDVRLVRALCGRHVEAAAA